MWQLDVPVGAEPVGYRFLVEHFRLEVMAHYRWSYIGLGWDFKEFKYEHNNVELHLFPKSYQIKKDPVSHLEFALKHEGMNLAIIKQAFSKIGSQPVTDYVQASPTGKYARKIWFLYEFLLDEKLPLENVGRGSYVTLLDQNLYYCGVSRKSPRHRVVDNLLGNSQFSPLVRKSIRLDQLKEKNLHHVATELAKKYDSEVLTRAIRYLFTKETIASWEIEREKPDKARIAKFVTLLQQDYADNELSKRFLVRLQKEIVDYRFMLEDYRSFQNYVGEEPQLGKMLIHYISPRPQDLPSLMEGYIKCAARMFSSDVDPVITAAVLSFGFVFMHPFWDGNGRLHRFLIHYTLSKLGFVPKGIVFPVSAVMLREYKEYDKVLEYFSRPLNELIHNYQLDERAEMTVIQETADHYRYIDFTPIAEFLYRCVEQTIHTDLEEELDFLSRYDTIKASIKNIIDMPDKEIDLFIRCVRQNNGTLSKSKRKSWFHMLSDAEIDHMEKVICSGESV
jgi:hypothetical protein